MKTFKMGGVHPEENKISTNAVIEQMPLPKQVAVLMNQHLGAPATPIVAKGDKVTLVGFGTFSTVKRPERTAKNPRTGAPITIPAKTIAKFKPGSKLVEAVN